MMIKPFILPATLITLVAVSFSGCHEKPSEAPAPSAPKVDGNALSLPAGASQIDFIKVQPALKNDAALAPFSGRLNWNEDSTVRIYTPVAGRVEKILAELGQKVAISTPLAIISSPDYGISQANAAKADSDLRQAQKVLSRDQDLFQHGAVAAKDVEEDQADLESKQAEAQRAMAQLDLYGGKLGEIDQRFTLRSPIAGVIVERNITVGEQVREDAILANVPQGYQPLFTISNPDTLWVSLDASENDLAQLKVGQKLSIRTRALGDEIFPAVIEDIGQELDPSTRTLKVRARVDNPGRKLRAQMYVTADLEHAPTGGVLIPVHALFRDKEQNCVFIEKAPGEYERRQVTTQAENNGQVEVSQGLEVGDRVVVDGALALEKIIEGSKGG